MSEETQQLGRYELIKRIAVGGMGAIYLAKSRGAGGFEKTVIIKKILDHLADEPEFITKFLDEGRTVVHLTHGNIVPVFDMGSEGGEYFIAMEYLPGRDLRDVLKRSSEKGALIPLSLAVFITIEVCKGLDYAHRCTGEDGAPLGIVHRDVSPSNVLISRDGEVKIIDFGIARATSRVAKTMTGRIQGKVCYMSPEQATGKEVDSRSDIFSTGIVLYEMLTGVRVFQGDSDLQSLDHVRQCEVAPPSSLNPKIPPELDAIVLRALVADRDARYQTIDALHVALLEWLYGRGRAVTSQQLAEFAGELFPEGFERKELRRARDPSSLGSSEGAKFNLDDALNAEFAKLGGLETLEQASQRTASATVSATASAQIDPLSLTAEAVEDEAVEEPSSAQVSVGEDVDAREDAPESGATELDSHDISASLLTADASSERAEDRGFKRWMFIALLLGSVVGVGGLYFYLLNDHGKVDIRTDPAGASIRVDGVKVSGVSTPHTLELVAGEHIIDLRKDGYIEQNLSLRVGARERLVLDGDTIVLQPRAKATSGVRQAWITVLPVDATITIDNGARVETGQARIEVAPDAQVLVSVSHPGCRTRNEVVTYDAAAKAISIELKCDDAAQDPVDAGHDASNLASKDDASESSVAAENKPAARPEKATPLFSVIRFVSDPAGAQIKLDGQPIEGAQRLKIGREIRVEASLEGYKTAKKTLRVSRALGATYKLELEKSLVGCVLIRPRAGQQVEVLIDGDSVGRTAGARFDVAAGAHKIELIWGDQSRSQYDITVAPGDTCSGPLGFESAPDP